jgi:hypothetical protein
MSSIITTYYVPILILAFLTAGCAALEYGKPTAMPPSETPSPSPTIDWFPATPTAIVQQIATKPIAPEIQPVFGRILLTDNFADPEAWNLATSDRASAAIKDNQIILGVQPETYMVSLRDDRVFADFYAEIKAKPILCRDSDEYGLLIRGTTAAHYRFVLTCNGSVRADRASVEERHIIQDFVLSGDVPPGAPGEVRIGVWAGGDQMQLFLNDRFQFSIEDANYRSGLIGMFVRADGDTPATVAFSDLIVREVSPGNFDLTPTPNR